MTCRKKRSLIWAMPDIEFIELIKKSPTLGSILSKFGLQNKGGNSHTLKTRISYLNIDISHIVLGIGSNKGKKFNKIKVNLNDVLTTNSTYSRGRLKKRLITEGVLKNRCYICEQLPFWSSRPLVLVLDHINGIPNDNRIENLRLLCPNCNSQTDTFAGKNIKIQLTNAVQLTKMYVCPVCNEPKKCKTSKKCPLCFSKSRRKIIRPSKQILLKDVEELGYCSTGRKYGVSDNAIRKWLTSFDSNEDK